jgi:hypothetical protein
MQDSVQTLPAPAIRAARTPAQKERTMSDYRIQPVAVALIWLHGSV